MLKVGYSPETIEYNISHEIRRGVPPKASVAIAYRKARESFQIAHPRRPFPDHLKVRHEIARKG